MNISFPNNVFPIGTHVYREPHPPLEEILADLPLLKKLGFNMIKVQESWAIDEPREGEIDFSQIAKVIAYADELNLGVYLGLTMEQAPAWLWKKYPDCLMVYADGQQCNDPTQYLLPNDGKPGPCWDHPSARESGERFLAELVKQLGRFNNIRVWNTFQEIGFWWRPNVDSVLGFCYCPHTLKAYQKWIRKKYSTLENVNSLWKTAYGDWEEIEPPRRFPFVPAFVEWRYFMDNVYLTRNLEWKTEVIKKNDPEKRPVFSHVGGPYVGSGAEWRWSKVGDFFGMSIYPAWVPFDHWDDDYQNLDNEHTSYHAQIWDSLNFRIDYSRSASGRDQIFWGAEFQGGPISDFFHMGKTPDALDIRRWMLAGLSAGLNGISFWNHRCEIFGKEGNGFGLLDPQGSSTIRIEEAGRIGRAINEDPEIFSLGKVPCTEVAILINENLYHFCQSIEDYEATKHLEYSIRGNYYRLWQMGIWADFIEAEQVKRGLLKDYKAVILPFPIALEEEYFLYLKEYVHNGGVLISEAIPGRFDKYGMCPRSQMVEGGEEIFGARHKSLQIVCQPEGRTAWIIDERSYGEFAPATILEGVGELQLCKLRASLLLQTLEPVIAEPIIMAGDEVAGTINSYGKGKAILIGTIAGHSALAHKLDDGHCIIGNIMALAHVKGDRCGKLLRRKRIHDNKEAWFLINQTDNKITETINIKGFSKVRDLLGDAIIDKKENLIEIEVPADNLCCLVLIK